ncbi:monothiol glutaredoxin grx4 [Pleurotus ostreatus]|uniref:Monothiol glutaredoxin grx4 n=1 Tax=Pleurotus ostreatus TaxID=5322 RepID=A0A8H6ZRU8_PLEOS|nr:monothiol glutaredoxin grx4 [Pleurotus ostreatus]KAF7424741.1 monothiol glutaredoxin grx4 [Pleurotus ostreatus]
MSTEPSPANFKVVESPSQFQELLSADLNRVSLINFWAPWAEPCHQMNEVVLELAKKYSQLLVLQVEAEEQSDIAESFDIEAVPAFIILRGHTLLARVSGADAAGLTTSIATHLRSGPTINPTSKTDQQPQAPSARSQLNEKIETEEELNERLRNLMTSNKVMLFMKGSPDAPRCGFSRKIVELLREQGVPDFGHFDILEDENVRSGLKKLNEWPTFPQLIINGEFVGGLDIVKEMVENGEFAETLAS